MLSLNTWSHLASTYDGAMLRVYLNGALVASAARSGSILTSANPLQIGGDSIYGQYFQGLIDEVRVYNVPLTQAQIQADMSTPVGGAAPPDTTPPTAPTGLTANAAGSSQINLAWTASTDNVAVTGYRVERCQGAGCANFAQIATPLGHDLQRHGADGGHQLQLPGAGGRCGQQPERLLERGQRHDCFRHDAADGAHRPDGQRRRLQPDQPRLDGLHRQRGRDRLPGRALPGRGLHQLRADRDARRRHDLQRHGPDGGHQLQLPGAGRSMRPAT